MNQNKHTPGPWMIQSCPDNPFHYYVVDSPTESYLIAGPFLKANKMKPDTRDEQRQADAKLIAAAPVLLELLQDISHQIEKGGTLHGSSLIFREDRPAIDVIKEAIAKAT